VALNGFTTCAEVAAIDGTAHIRRLSRPRMTGHVAIRHRLSPRAPHCATCAARAARGSRR